MAASKPTYLLNNGVLLSPTYSQLVCQHLTHSLPYARRSDHFGKNNLEPSHANFISEIKLHGAKLLTLFICKPLPHIIQRLTTLLNFLIVGNRSITLPYGCFRTTLDTSRSIISSDASHHHMINGGRGGSRTLNPVRATDFKSVAYTSSATRPY